MAIAVEATSSGNQAGADADFTFTHVVTAANLVLVLVARGQSGGTGTISSVASSINGAFTFVGRSETGGSWGQVEIWKLASPTAGSHTITVTADTTELQMSGFGIGFTGASLTLPSISSQGGTSTNPSISVSSTSGDIVVGAIASDVGSLDTITANQTLIAEFEDIGGGDSDTSAEYTTAAGASTTLSWVCATSGQHWQIGAIAVSPAASSGGFLNRNYWWDNY